MLVLSEKEDNRALLLILFVKGRLAKMDLVYNLDKFTYSINNAIKESYVKISNQSDICIRLGCRGYIITPVPRKSKIDDGREDGDHILKEIKYDT